MTTRMAEARARIAQLYADAGGDRRLALAHALDEYASATRAYCLNPIDVADVARAASLRLCDGCSQPQTFCFADCPARLAGGWER